MFEIDTLQAINWRMEWIKIINLSIFCAILLEANNLSRTHARAATAVEKLAKIICHATTKLLLVDGYGFKGGTTSRKKFKFST